MPLAPRLLSSFLRLFFYLLYNPLAWAYDWVAAAVSWGHWREWVLSALPYLAGERILELGHGPGHLQVAMEQRGFQVFGLDLSPTMGKIARERLSRSSALFRLVRGNAQHLPFRSDVFDTVVSTFPSEYFFQVQTLEEIYRILVPGGCLVVVPFAWIDPKGWIGRMLGRLFQLTHQSPPQNDERWKLFFVERFQQVGFYVRLERVELPSGKVFLVLASKPNLM